MNVYFGYCIKLCMIICFSVNVRQCISVVHVQLRFKTFFIYYIAFLLSRVAANFN